MKTRIWVALGLAAGATASSPPSLGDQLTPEFLLCSGPVKELYCKEKKLVKGLFHCESLSANDAQASWLSSSAIKCTNNISIPTSASAVCGLRTLGYCWCRHSPKTSNGPSSCWETAAAISTGLGCGPRLGRIDAIHPRAKAALLQEPDSSPLLCLFTVSVQLTAQRRSVEFHITPVKTKLEPGPTGFRVGLVQLWF